MPVVKKYLAEVVSVKNPVDAIFVVEFRSLDKKFKYLPGQFLHLSLDEYDPSLAWPESRCFSMQTSPSHANIVITFAVKGKFTLRMSRELVEGKRIYLKLPYGDLFSQSYDKEQCVFIAGGTGVTPFLSLFTDPSFSHYQSAKLYFGIRSSTHHIYHEALRQASDINKQFLMNIIDEEAEGKLNIDTIFKENSLNSIYFISGPPVMITLFRKHLLQAGVVSANIKTDEWE
jgi:predicted ferric reductase